MVIKKNYSLQLLAAGLLFVFVSACSLFEYGYENADYAPEVELDVEWQIPAIDPGGGFNSLYYKNYMYQPLHSQSKVQVVDLDKRAVINEINVKTDTNPVKNGDYIYITNCFQEDGYPILYFYSIEGELIGRIPFTKDYNGWSFTLFSRGNYIYWRIFPYDEMESFVRIDTSKITHVKDDEYSAEVQVLYPLGKNNFGAIPTFYDGKMYLPVDDKDFEGPTRVLIFDEESGTFEKELVLSDFVPAFTDTEVFLSEEASLVGDRKFNLTTGELYQKLPICTHSAPYTFAGGYGYASSSDHGGTEFTSLWKLNMKSLDVEWSYQDPYSCGSQPQVVNNIVYLNTSTMTLLFNADTGKIIGKSTKVKGHPVQRSSSCIYDDLLIFHDGYNITAIKTNWKINSLGRLEKIE